MHGNALRILLVIIFACVAPQAAQATDGASTNKASIVAPAACFQIFDFTYPKGRPEIDMLLELQQDAFKSLGIAGEKSTTPSIASLWADGFSVYFGRPCAAARQDFAGLVENYNQQSARIKVTPSPLPLTPETLSCGTQAQENCPSAHPENQIAIGKPDAPQSPSNDTSNANHNTPPLPAQCFALFKAAYPAAISNIFEQDALRHAFLNRLSNTARQHNIKGLSGSYMGDGQMIIWPTTSCAQSTPIIRQLIETQNTQSQNIDMHFRTDDVDWYDAYCGLGHTSASCPAANNVAINK